MAQNSSPTIIDTGSFRAFHFDSKPPRLEAALAFDSDHFSQKLVFQVMDITHRHGMACSSPQFGKDENEGRVIFCIGLLLPSSRSLKKHLDRLGACLADLTTFHAECLRQMDFSRLDLSMLQVSDAELDPAFMAAVRDQHYGGSWEEFRKDMMNEGRKDEAEIVDRLRLFEQVNNKDLAYMGNRLEPILDRLEESEFDPEDRQAN